MKLFGRLSQPFRTRSAKGLFASVILHVALALWLLAIPPYPKTVWKKTETIELIENGKDNGSQVQTPPQRSKQRSKQTSQPSTKKNPRHSNTSPRESAPLNQKLTLDDLTPSFAPRVDTSHEGGENEGSSSAKGSANDAEPGFDSPDAYLLTSEGLEKSGDMRGFLEAIFDRVNSRLVFDSLLAQYGHFGIVYCEFAVDSRGVLVPSFVQAKALDRILKVHAMRALRAGLSKPLPTSLHLPNDKSVTLRARFQFIPGGSSLFDENPTRIAGHAFTFRRLTDEIQVPKKIADQLLSGGISYDPFAMYESWQRYFKHKERRRLDTDPFALYRNDPDY